jgi:serine/threonine protein kinase
MYGQYHVIERIAVGGMAEIYLGIAHGVEGFERQVVIKKVRRRLSRDTRFHSMLVKEAKITASLNHPNIVQILDLGQNERQEYFIVMEYVDGRDLRSIMDRAEEKGFRLDRDQVLYIAAEICAALDYAHHKSDDQGRPLNLIHRDVSPSNILVSRAGEVKLADFGIARYGRDVSVVGSLKGKLAYMSPEQARTQILDRRSDIFSLGAVTYENLLGQRVFPADNDVELLEQVREARIPRPASIDPTIPEELELILLRALARDPDNRFQTAGEMGLALRRFHFQHSSLLVGPEQLAGLLRRLFPEDEPATRARQPKSPYKFSITHSIVLDHELEAPPPDEFPQPHPGAPEARGPEFADVVTSPGGPPPELLARLRDTARDDEKRRDWARGPEPITAEERQGFAGNLDVLKVVTNIQPRRRWPALKPEQIARETTDEDAPESSFDDVPTEVASPRGLRAFGQKTPTEPTPVVARVESIVDSIEEELERDIEGRPTARRVPLQPEEQAPPPAGVAPGPVPPREPTHLLEPESAPPAAADPPAVAQLPVAAAPERPGRGWAAWVVVAALGLSIGGGAALLLLIPDGPFAGSPRPRPVARAPLPDVQGPPDSGLALTAAPDAAALADASGASARPPVAEPPAEAVRPPRSHRTPVRRPRSPTPDRPPRPPRRAKGQVVIKSDPWAYIHVDGRDTGRTTSAQPFSLPAGRHRIELVNPALGLRQSLEIEVEADGLVRRFVRLR